MKQNLDGFHPVWVVEEKKKDGWRRQGRGVIIVKLRVYDLDGWGMCWRFFYLWDRCPLFVWLSSKSAAGANSQLVQSLVISFSLSSSLPHTHTWKDTSRTNYRPTITPPPSHNNTPSSTLAPGCITNSLAHRRHYCKSIWQTRGWAAEYIHAPCAGVATCTHTGVNRPSSCSMSTSISTVDCLMFRRGAQVGDGEGRRAGRYWRPGSRGPGDLSRGPAVGRWCRHNDWIY